ncbi:hypothetical protein [Candidatus Binatus sp.]|jgi:hypothetical protein|uniref:hypothetical protein n=1 Tax=Candidatus Binatus sp. TaxID=2811406 RepID=UPI002FDB553F
MTNSEILGKAGFRETPDGQWRYHLDLRKAFNAETQRDATNQWIEKCVAQPVTAGFFEFYFWTGGADGTPACKALLNQLRSTDMIKIVRMH